MLVPLIIDKFWIYACSHDQCKDKECRSVIQVIIHPVQHTLKVNISYSCDFGKPGNLSPA